MNTDCGIDNLAHTAPKEETVGEHLDHAIEQARKQVERLCILKAKAEASNILNFPSEFIRDIAFCH